MCIRDRHNTAVQQSNTDTQDLPFRGGWFLYLGYELAGQLEPSLQLPTATDGLPIALAVRIPAAIIVDHHQRETIAIIEDEYAALLDDLLESVKECGVGPVSYTHLDVYKRQNHYSASCD